MDASCSGHGRTSGHGPAQGGDGRGVGNVPVLCC